MENKKNLSLRQLKIEAKQLKNINENEWDKNS